MTIECPYCREECLSDVDSIPPEGLEIECRNCQMTFIMRPHESESRRTPDEPDRPADKPVSAPPPAPPHPSAVTGGDTAPEHYETVLRTRKETPAWMVQAYDTPPAPVTDTTPEENILSGDLHGTGEEGDPPPILVDDTLYEDNPYADEPFTPQAYPREKKAKGAGRYAGSGNGKRWTLRLILLALGVALIVLTWKMGLKGVFQKADDLSRSIAGLISSGENEEGGLHFSNLNSDFVQQKEGKSKVFFIDGKVTNNYPKPCHSIQVKGILFDERGKRSAEETVFCGNILTKKELRSASDDRIRESLQNPVGSSLSNFNIQPGTSIPFMLVFFDPPDKLSEFSIEIAGYKLHETETE